jgi:hypothetical protein
MAKRRRSKTKQPAVKRTVRARPASRRLGAKFECPGDCAKLTVDTLQGQPSWLVVNL